MRRWMLVLPLLLAGCGPTAAPAPSPTAPMSWPTPTLGATDTGATHTVHYEVVGDNLQGLGRVDHLRYQDPLTGEVTDLTDVPLPWTLELPFFLEGGGASRPRASLAAFGDDADNLTCRLAVDGVDAVDDFGVTSVTCDLPSA